MAGPTTEAMGGLLRVDPASAEPPFEQVRRQLAEAIGDGRLPVGERLPPIRALAGELALAVNTVARAYRELEVAGLVLTRGRLGTVVSPDAGPSGSASAAGTASGGAGTASGGTGTASGGTGTASGAAGTASGAAGTASGAASAGAAHAAVRLAAGDYARAARAAGIPETDAVAFVRDAFRRLG